MHRRLATIALLAIVLGAGVHLAEGVVPTTANLTLHGSDELGPLEGPVEVTVRIFDAADGGTMFFEETHETTATEGLMYLELGAVGGGALDASVFDGGDRWVELVVDGTTMSPRLKVGVVPYAVAAGSADTAASADTVGDLRPEDLAPADHDHAGDYLPVGSSLSCPGGVVIGLSGGTGDVICGTVDDVVTYGAAAGGGLALDANNDFSIAPDGVTAARIAAGAVGTSEVANGSLTAADLAPGSVGASEIIDGSVRRAEVLQEYRNCNAATDLCERSALDNRYYTKTSSDNRYYTKTDSDNRYYTRTQSDSRFLNVGVDVQAGWVIGTDVAMCTNQRVVGFATPFNGPPVVSLIPEATDFANTTCIVSDLTTANNFTFCCHGQVPDAVHWTARRPTQ